jgi:ribosomal protein S18 acetylase RimI-like enzyme
MDRSFQLTSPDHPGLLLRTAGEDDLENLRLWKNANKQYFFFQGTIRSEMQQEWFAAYRRREHDYMFIVNADGSEIGCMGVRLQDGTCDIYNVILGRREAGRKGFMSRALLLMCSFARRYGTSVSLKVLRENPAVEWYRRNGFRQAGEGKGHLVLELHTSQFSPCAIEEQGLGGGVAEGR